SPHTVSLLVDTAAYTKLSTKVSIHRAERVLCCAQPGEVEKRAIDRSASQPGDLGDVRSIDRSPVTNERVVGVVEGCRASNGVHSFFVEPCEEGQSVQRRGAYERKDR